jgi:nucleoside-diphosphate-sugar epimerase
VTWLVTGGAGFLGVHLLRRLVEHGVPARSLDLTPGAPADVEEIVGDVRDARVVRDALDGIDVVLHAAAALPSGGDLETTNVEATSSIARLAKERGVKRAILVSSGVVYGVGASPYREDDPPRPIEGYGRSKLRAEEAWLDAAPAPVVLRPAAFIGPERLGVFGILFRWVREGRRIYVLGDGGNRYQLLDVADLVTAIVLGGESPVEGVVNIGGVVSGTVRGDLETLIAHAGSESRVVGVPAKPAQAILTTLTALRLSPLTAWHVRSADRDFVLDCARAGEALGWTPTRSGADALRAAYDWYVREGASRPAGTTHRAAWRERGLSALRRLS